jgi:hypothetical protein
MNEERIRIKDLNMKLKGKRPRARPHSRWGWVKKDITQKEGGTWDVIEDELWGDREAWLLGDQHKCGKAESKSGMLDKSVSHVQSC